MTVDNYEAVDGFKDAAIKRRIKHQPSRNAPASVSGNWKKSITAPKNRLLRSTRERTRIIEIDEAVSHLTLYIDKRMERKRLLQ